MLEKWKKAVIHLECATDSNPINFRSLISKRTSGEITTETFIQYLSEGRSRDIRYHGTALFIIYNSRRYLLTARHVVHDELSEKRENDERSGQPFASVRGKISDTIFNFICRVPSLDELQNLNFGKTTPAFLMCLNAGDPPSLPYTFSDPSLDLAIISLDQRDGRFADELIELGYEPIPSEDISDGPISEGSDLFTVGFPESTAVIGQIPLSPALAHWASCKFSLPAFSFGRVSMLHDALPFYWADLSIYPGNSGGPVIENDKLVGVVSAQAITPIDSAPNITTRIPFGKIIKTKYVLELLLAQEEKDKFMARPLETQPSIP